MDSRVLGDPDVVVVGGGVVGCTIAYELAKRGVSVQLLERDTLGSHSTGKNAGGVRKLFSTEANVKLQKLSLQLLDDLDTELGVDSGFKKIGYLFAFSQEDDASRFFGYLSMWRELGVDEVYWVEPDEIGQLSPAVQTRDLVGGIFCPSDGVASPSDVTYAYVNSARRLGARISEHAAVTGIRRSRKGIEVAVAHDQVITCETVFVCAGAWSHKVGRLAGIDLPVLPYPRHIFVTGPVSGVSSDTPMTIDFATGFYFHPEGEGALFGIGEDSSRPSFSTTPDWTRLEAAREIIALRVPSFMDAPIKTGWAGLYEVTPDHQPILGPTEPDRRIWCACGFSGHGFMQAPAVALLLAEQFVGRSPGLDISAFAHSRFEKGNLVAEVAVI